MSTEDAGANPLVGKILSDARAEAARLVAEAEGNARKRREISAQECRTIQGQAQARTDERLAALQRNTNSRINVESKRARLRVRDRIVFEAQAAARERLAALIGSAEYRRMLVGWIAEAAIGLGEPRAEVNASAAERTDIDAQLLGDAVREVRESVGREVSLTLSAAPPLLGQGVILTSPNGRVAYNSQVATRLLREQSRIRSLIHGALFASE